MADKAIFEIVVTNKGLKINQKGLDDLGTSAQRANKASGDLYSTQAKGVIGTANSSKSFSKLAETIGNGGGGLVGAYATLAANAFAVSAAFSALRNGAQVQQIMEGLELQGARTGRSLSTVAANIEKITQGALSGADAMRAAALGTSAGLSSKDLSSLTEVATNASLVLGRSIPDSMDRIIKGVTKLEPELLDELGLMTKLTEASENYARANNKSASSLTNIEKRLAFVEAIKAEGTLKYDGVAEELGTNNLDKLAAAFVNLSNSITGSIATSGPLSFILDTLINSSTALVGALTILGSYVASQFTNSLRMASRASLDEAKNLDKKTKALKEYTAEQMGSTKATFERASADAAAAASLNRTQRGKAAATQEASIGGDRAAQEAWVKSRENSNKRYERELIKLSGIETEAAKKRIKNIEESIQGNILEIEATKEAIRSEEAYSSAKARTAQTDLRMRAAQQGSLAQGRASLAMEAAAAFRVDQAYRNVIDSTRNYSNQLMLTSQASAIAASNATANGRATSFLTTALNFVAPAATKARVALFGLSLGVKAVGIAFATALPWIGVITIAFSLAQLAYDNLFKSNETKAKEKALEELSTVLDTLTKGVKEYNKVLGSDSISIGDKAFKSLTIQTNAMVELTNAYLSFSEASDKAKAAQSSEDFFSQASTADIIGALNPSNAVNSLIGEYNKAILYLVPSVDQELLKKELGLATDIAARAATDMVSKFDILTDFLGGDGISDSEKELLKTIDTIATFDKALAESIEVSGDFETTQKNIASALRIAKPVWEEAQLAIQNFGESVKIAETAQADFMRSLAPTTKFDNVLSAFTGLNRALEQVQKTLSDGRFDDTAFSELLTGLGPSTTRVLDVSDQLNLESVKSQYRDIKTLQQELKTLQEEGKGSSREALDIEAKVLDIRGRITTALRNSEPSIVRATQEYRKQLIDSQVMAISMQGNLAIAQANLSVIQRRGVVLAEDASKQMRAENAIIALQQEQLKAEKLFIDIDIAKQKYKLDEIKNTLVLLSALKEVEKVERDRQITQQIAANTAKAASYRAQKDERSANIIEARNSSLEAARTDYSKEYLRLKTQEKEVEDSLIVSMTQSQAIGKNILALGMNAYSIAEMRAAEARKQLEIDTSQLAILRERQNLDESIRLTNIGITNDIRMQGRALELQGNQIKSRLKEQRIAIEDERKQKISALSIERDLAKAQGLSRRVDFYTKEIAQVNSLYDRKFLLVSVEAEREIVQLAAVKSLQEELELQKEVLSVREKIVESVKELSSAAVDRFNTIIDLEAKRAGVTDTESIQQIKAIRAAEEAYKIAQAEYDLKVSLIKMEFSLLEAQRAQQILDLTSRKELLEERKSTLDDIVSNTSLPNEILVTANKERTAVDSNISILSSAISELSKVNFKDALDNSLKAAGILKDTAKLNLELVKTPGLRAQGGLTSNFSNIGARVQAGSDAGLEESAIILEGLNIHFSTIKESLEALGPEGAVVSAIVEGAMNISNSFLDAFTIMGDAGSSTGQRIAAGLQVASAAVGAIMSILSASSNARISEIDREIAAEQKRDGTSAKSVAVIETLEKKKDSIARKAFNTNKKLMMAQAVMSTAAGIAGALASSATIGPVAAAIMAGIIGAMGAAQIAVIAGTQYQSTSSASKAVAPPSTLTIGRSGDSVDLARGPNANAGGEAGFIRGSQGTGSNASNFRTIGSAYGGELMRGYGNRGFVVGEKGPEVITPETPINVTPANDVMPSQPLNATFNIQALDASGVEELLVAQKGNIISMLRSAANAAGQGFMEDVNTNIYTRPSVNKL